MVPFMLMSTYYQTQSLLTDPGRHAELYSALPSRVGQLAAIVQNLIIDKDFVRLFGLQLDDASRLGELDTRYLSDIHDRLLARDPRALFEIRDPKNRFVGSCRDYALLLCSMLRHLGVPARLRFGFATYFSKEPNTFGDHCVCEYWNEEQGRWVLVDCNVDPVIKQRLEITANELDLRRDEFVVAADAWQLVRSGEVDGNHFGVPSINITGQWFIRGSLMRDLAALNKMEMLPWDYWGLADKDPVDDLPSSELPVLDELAAILSTPDDLQALQTFYARGDFQVPGTIKSYSPLNGAIRVKLLRVNPAIS